MTEAIKINVSEKMQKSLDSYKSDLAKIRTGRAHTGLLDHIFIDYYGSMVPINQVAGVNLGDAKTINVQPYEKNMVAKVEKAIRDSDLGLNPATSGDLIRVPMPSLTEERRKDLIKVVRTEAESAKVATSARDGTGRGLNTAESPSTASRGWYENRRSRGTSPGRRIARHAGHPTESAIR